MNRYRWIGWFSAIALAGLLAGCRTSPTVRQVQPAEQSVALEAGSYYFRPNVLQVARPGSLTLQIGNVAGVEHNITVEDPDGNRIAGMDLPAGQTVSLALRLDQPGTYDFHCDKPFHSLFGMRGRIEVGQ
jgi:plastocyanin